MAKKIYTRQEVDDHIKVLNRIAYSQANSFNVRDIKRFMRRSDQIIKQLNRPTRDY